MSSRRPFRLTIVHPCVGRPRGMKHYIRTWQMECLPAAMIAALTPADVEKKFYDDRLESIPYDEPTDLVAISVETYTAKRAYQIASEYRRRGVPVVMGGFHATLCPDEVQIYADTLVIGEAEGVFEQVIDDYRHGTPKSTYHSESRPVLKTTPDRSIFQGKRYLPIRLVEFARGCRFRCDFCAIQSFFNATHSHRPVDCVLEEIARVRRPGQMVFFIDDNLTSGLNEARELMEALIPLKLRWVSQTAINVAHDEDTLDLMRRSGCQGVLIGFESLHAESLKQMNKSFNLMAGGPAKALANMAKHKLSVYGTFIFGYDHDTPHSIAETVDFAIDHGLFIAAFNHITPFPGTPLYQRMQAENRLLYDAWWLDDRYRYNMIPFQPRSMSPEELSRECLGARRRFYSWSSIARRGFARVNRRTPYLLWNHLVINAMHHWDVDSRSGLPLGDESWTGDLLPARRSN
ncbi:MAG: radical SAM protein [Planctomycetota bacterium]|nr:radical SAM protein [Planctomycetota bacterium]